MNDNMSVRPSERVVETTHRELERVLRDRLHRSNQVVVNPTLWKQELDYDGIRFSRKHLDILVIILVYHFSDFLGIFREYIRYEIERYLEKNLLKPELFASFKDKRVCLEILLTLNYSTREIFSLVSEKNLERVLRDLELRVIYPRPVKEPVYRRGYNDKGSLLAESKRPADEPDGSLQLQIERERELYQLTVELIIREVGGWVLRDQSLDN